MANEQNLKVPSSKEARENGKKGGVASGKSRRKKANLKKAFETILQAEVASPNVKKQLEELGFDEMALAMVMMQKAMKGNVRAFEQISKLTTTDAKDALDKKEQKERIKALQIRNKRDERTLDSDIANKRVIEIKVGDWDAGED